MALTPKTLYKIGGANPGLFIYKSADTIATIGASAYFNGVVDSIHQFDVIIVVSEVGATTKIDVAYVTSAEGATPVTVGSTEGVTATTAAAEDARTSKEMAYGQKLLAEAGSRAAAVNRVSEHVEDPIEEQLEAEKQERELADAAIDKALEFARRDMSTQDGKPVKDDKPAKEFADTADTKPRKNEKAKDD